jgi:hypothetical protein
MKYAKVCLHVALLLWGGALGCASETAGGGAALDGGGEDVWTRQDAFSTDASDAVIVTKTCPAVEDPKGDADGDGLRNDLEDRNRNCQVDEGETDPTAADTDEDGLLDGWEDLNADGVVNDGELDPRRADTDGDGTPDGLESLALVCGPPLLAGVEGYAVPALGLSVALPTGLGLVTEGQAALIAGEVQGAEVAGLVVVMEEMGEDAQSALRQAMERAKRASGLALRWEQQRAWVMAGDEALEPRAAASGVLRLEAADGRGLTEVRDALASALVGAQVGGGGGGGGRCAEVEVHVGGALHAGGRLMVGLALGCASERVGDGLGAFGEDWRSGSLVVPGVRTPTGYHCQQQRVTLGQGEVDVLWVMDNSASMRDEEERVRRVAGALMATLQASPLRWRVGVTTTEAYLLDELTQPPPEDPLLGACSGLRGQGFVGPEQADAALLFERWLFEDEGCDLRGVSAAFKVGANLCGAQRESGLLSALSVLKRTDPARSVCEKGAQRRPGVKAVVFWVSDEDDGLMQDPLTGEALAEDDPQRHMFTRAVSAQLQQERVQGCALVGDEGIARGGLCSVFKGEYSTGSEEGVAYREVVKGLGGVVGSICGRGDSQALVSACLGGVAGFGRRYRVERLPIAGSLVVAVDGQVLRRGEGWWWDGEAGEVVLGEGVALNERSKVAVALLRWR